jgi:predicted secreted hydrolase
MMKKDRFKRVIKVLAGVLVVLLLLVATSALLRRGDNQIQASLVSAAPGSENPGDAQEFERAAGPAPLRFPEDHGPHPDFQTEWWYYTGNLATPDGRRFGYQLTFFRRALVPPNRRAERVSDWAMDHVYMAHLALTDVGGGKYHAFERLSRGAAGLAGAQAAPYQVWLENWRAEETEPDQYRLAASQDSVAIDLQLDDLKGPVLQGDRGYSRKGPEPGNASYYYSLTRLATHGTIRIGDEYFQVEGLSWMDHEFSTSALSSGQVGWDWFSIQLGDQSELMVFQIRRQDGSLDPYSSGIYVAPDGSTTALLEDDFDIQVLDTWRSPHSGAVYPSRWRLLISSIDMALEIEPHLQDQELNVSYSYWEGAVRVEGSSSGREVDGNGYVELTGYSRSMTGEF